MFEVITRRTLDRLRSRLPLLVTNLDWADFAEHPAVAAAIEEGARRDGFSISLPLTTPPRYGGIALRSGAGVGVPSDVGNLPDWWWPAGPPSSPLPGSADGSGRQSGNVPRLAAITGEATYHRTFFGPANVGIHRAAVVLELSRTGEALRLAERVDVGDLPSVERRYSHYLQLGRAYAIRREDLAAVHMLGRADRESPEDSRLNLVMRATVRELLVRETPTTRPDLRGLAERVGVI